MWCSQRRQLMRLRSLSISATLVFVLAALFLSAVMPRAAYAQSSGQGITCSTVNGVYVCTQNGTGGSICVTDDSTGTQTCENVVNGGTSSGGSSSLGTGLGSTNQQPVSAGGTGWLSKLTNWIAYAINTVFDAVVAFLKDMVTYVIATVLGLVSSAISAIGTPSWLSQYSLQSILQPTLGTLGFFLAEFQIPLALGLIGLGYVFRLLRKFLTLFQW